MAEQTPKTPDGNSAAGTGSSRRAQEPGPYLGAIHNLVYRVRQLLTTDIHPDPAATFAGLAAAADEVDATEAKLVASLNAPLSIDAQLDTARADLAHARSAGAAYKRHRDAARAENAQWQAEIANLRTLIAGKTDADAIVVGAIRRALRNGPPPAPEYYWVVGTEDAHESLRGVFTTEEAATAAAAELPGLDVSSITLNRTYPVDAAPPASTTEHPQPDDTQVLAALSVLGWPDDRTTSAHPGTTEAGYYWATAAQIVAASAATIAPPPGWDLDAVHHLMQRVQTPTAIRGYPQDRTGDGVPETEQAPPHDHGKPRTWPQSVAPDDIADVLEVEGHGRFVLCIRRTTPPGGTTYVHQDDVDEHGVQRGLTWTLGRLRELGDVREVQA